MVPLAPSGPPGLPGNPSGSTNPCSDCITALKRCVSCICSYLEISSSRVPDDAYVSIRELIRYIATLEADGQQDAAEIKALL